MVEAHWNRFDGSGREDHVGVSGQVSALLLGATTHGSMAVSVEDCPSLSLTVEAFADCHARKICRGTIGAAVDRECEFLPDSEARARMAPQFAPVAF